MKCTLPGRHIKLFGKAVYCLSKIGDELYIEGLHDGLTIRTVNSSRSAYGCFHFFESFFMEYASGMNGDGNTGQSVKVKIAMKSCLGVFKSLSNLEKVVDYCNINYDEAESRLVFMLSCKHGIVKTHNLTFQDCESLQAIFSKELCQNVIRSSARVLQDCVANFPVQCEEISVSVTPQFIKFKNYIEDESELSKVVNTEMTLSPEEFEDCSIGIDTEITFCLKELRAILGFSEAVNQPINVHFETSGRPVSFSLDGDAAFKADFVLASLIDTTDSQMTQQSQCHTTAGVGILDRSKSNHGVSKQSKESVKAPGQSPKINNMGRPKVREGNGVEKRNQDKEKKDLQTTDLTNDTRNKKTKTGEESETTVHNREVDQVADDFFTDSFPYRDVFQQRSANKKANAPEDIDIQNQLPPVSSGRSGRPLSTPRSSQGGPNISKISMPNLGDSLPFEGSMENRNEPDSVPGTPPAKRYKSMLFGEDSEQNEDEQMVLAVDTDDEDD